MSITIDLSYLKNKPVNLSTLLVRESRINKDLYLLGELSDRHLTDYEIELKERRIARLNRCLEKCQTDIKQKLDALNTVDFAIMLVESPSLSDIAEDVEVRWMPMLRQKEMALYKSRVL